jgi:hypothetical protein
MNIAASCRLMGSLKTESSKAFETAEPVVDVSLFASLFAFFIVIYVLLPLIDPASPTGISGLFLE